ncbi:uncharacterized protein V6R79_020372 [Siganus canaliculatus]
MRSRQKTWLKIINGRSILPVIAPYLCPCENYSVAYLSALNRYKIQFYCTRATSKGVGPQPCRALASGKEVRCRSAKHRDGLQPIIILPEDNALAPPSGRIDTFRIRKVLL